MCIRDRLLPEQWGGVSPEAAKVLIEALDGYAALLVGPGLTQEKEAVQFVQRLFDAGERRKSAVGFLAGRADEPLSLIHISEPTRPY